MLIENGKITVKGVLALDGDLLYVDERLDASRARVAIQPGRMAVGSQGPSVKSWVSVSSASMPHLAAVDR
jgi:hypothetical protein